MPYFPLRLFFRERQIFFPLAASVLLNIFIWVYLGFLIKSTSEAVFLHYTVHFGVDLIGPWRNIFFLPLLGAVLILVNFFLAYFLHGLNKFFSRILVAAAVVLQLFLAGQAVFLVFLNL